MGVLEVDPGSFRDFKEKYDGMYSEMAMERAYLARIGDLQHALHLLYGDEIPGDWRAQAEAELDAEIAEAAIFGNGELADVS